MAKPRLKHRFRRLFLPLVLGILYCLVLLTWNTTFRSPEPPSKVSFVDEESLLRALVTAFDVRKTSPRLEDHWRACLNRAPPFPSDMFSGRGIAILAGGPLLAPAVASIAHLRKVECTLPVQLWTLEKEFPREQELHAGIVNLGGVTLHMLPAWLQLGNRFAYKAFVLLACGFEQVLFLDADVVVTKDPTYLFDLFEPLFTLVAWPDFWTLLKEARIWPAVGGFPGRGDYFPSQESGVVMVHKTNESWAALVLSVIFNYHHMLYYPAIYHGRKHISHGQGDKDTYQVAWHALHVPYRMMPPAATVGVEHNSKVCGSSIGQHDLSNVVVFVHHNGNKWKLKEWPQFARNGLNVSLVAQVKNVSEAYFTDGFDDKRSASFVDPPDGVGPLCVEYNIATVIRKMDDVVKRNVEQELVATLNEVYTAPWIK